MTEAERASQRETRSVLYITYAYDDPDEAPVLDVSGTLRAMRHWMRGRSGVCYRVERLADGSYGNEQFVEAVQQ